MGRLSLPFYGADLGSAVETADKILAKIKTNKFDKQDLEEFAEALVRVVEEIQAEIAE